MKFSLSLFALAIASLTAAYEMPADGEDGLYVVHTNEDGSQYHEYLGKSNATAPDVETIQKLRPRSNLQKRAKSVCEGVYGSASDANYAEYYLANEIAGGLSFTSTISYRVNTAWAYGCNYGNGQRPTSTSFNSYIRHLDDDCGTSQAAYWSYPEAAASYGRKFSSSFC